MDVWKAVRLTLCVVTMLALILAGGAALLSRGVPHFPYGDHGNRLAYKGPGVGQTRADPLAALSLYFFRQTPVQLEVEIVGEGYFQVEDRSGATYYTRDGSFEGRGSDLAWRPGLRSGGREFLLDHPYITIPYGSALDLDQQGRLHACDRGSWVTICQLTLCAFPNEASLEEVEPGLYKANGKTKDIRHILPGSFGDAFLRPRRH